MTAYIADTNLYVVASHDERFRDKFEQFIASHGPLLVSSITVAEVLIGVSDVVRHAAVTRAMTAGATILAPSADDWLTAGGTIARLGGELVTKGRSFWNDALLAAQCARLGAILVTNNTTDFRRLRRYVGVRAVPPFPSIS